MPPKMTPNSGAVKGTIDGILIGRSGRSSWARNPKAIYINIEM
jgi:hypothetical protein